METFVIYLKQVGVSFWEILAEMSPYLLFGFFVAGLLSVFISQNIVERHLGGKGFWPLFKASVFGIPLPLCSCGVIPVSMSLHKHGASKGATISFLLSTPQTGVDSIFVTYSLLGPVFAVFRPLAALATGIIGGTLVNVFGYKNHEEQAKVAKCTEVCCGSKRNKFSAGLKYGFVTLPADIGKELLVGLIIAALISALVPDGFFAEYLSNRIAAMFVMVALGIPVYVCASASVPVAAALILKGLSPGAALVFLMTGPATNAASFVTIWRILGHRTAIVYIFSVAACAIGGGFLLDFIISQTPVGEMAHTGHIMMPAVIKYLSALALIFILGFAIFRKNHVSAKQ
ncbi:MAG: SO_0444 family Cu/Zn efflux transporter [Phycisphaerae bacterium]|nr:SO_0444 family Cu/Zn efflux transporter [Phycisphaerae bacterium]